MKVLSEIVNVTLILHCNFSSTTESISVRDLTPKCNVFNKILFFYFYFILFLILKSLILTCIPKREPPSHLPPHNISLGHPHAPAPSMLYPASILLLIITSFRRLGTEKRNAKT